MIFQVGPAYIMCINGVLSNTDAVFAPYTGRLSPL